MAVPNYITIDGVPYMNVHVSSLKRDGEVLDGENAGRTKAGEMIRDVIGTYYNYTVTIDADMSDPVEYDELYSRLSAPTDSHLVTFPYAQSSLTFKCYVSSVSDELRTIQGGVARWGGMSFKFVAMQPQIRR